MRQITKRVVVVAGVLAMTVNAMAQSGESRKKLDFDRPAPLVLSKELGPRGTLVLDVNVGEVHVVRNAEEHKIRLEIQPGHFESESAVKDWVRQFEVAGDRAVVDLHLPKHQNHDHGAVVTLYVPSQTSLKVDLGIGEMDVSGVQGDKDLEVGIGQLTVEQADTSEYAHVDNSVRLGEVNDTVFHEEHGGFFPSERRIVNQGHYRLHAHVGIGELDLRPMAKVL